MIPPDLINDLAVLYSCDRNLLTAPLDSRTAQNLLANLRGTRLNHVQTVVKLAKQYAASLPEEFDAFKSNLTLAANFHDIGYCSELKVTGFHPLDGAIFLAAAKAPEEVIAAVLSHSGACAEARYYTAAESFYAKWRDFIPQSSLSDAVTYCDLRSSPNGQRVTPGERLAEICARYGENHPVTENVKSQTPELKKQVLRAFRYCRACGGNQAPWVFADVDSTLVLPGHPVTSNTEKAIGRFLVAGGRFTLATGKHPHAIASLADRLNLTGPHICLNGAALWDHEGIHAIATLGSPANGFCEGLKRAGIQGVGYLPKGIVSVGIATEEVNVTRLREIDEPPFCDMTNPSDFFKILCFVSPAELQHEQTVSDLATKAGLKCVRTSRHFYEVLPPDCTKGQAMDMVLAQFAFTPVLSIAIGDAENDISMFRNAGLSAAVSNATSAVKVAGDIQLLSCGDDGVAVFLDSLIDANPERL